MAGDDLPTILLLGDSLTQLAFEGWGAKLANVYQRRADVINRGCSGYNTEFYKRLPLPSLLNVCLVTIFFGANDASLPQENPHHYVSIPNYTANLSHLLDRVREQYGAQVRILVVTPPPLDHPQRLAYQIQRYGVNQATGVLERTTENTRRYADACRQWVESATATSCSTRLLACCDLFQLMLAEPDYGRFFHDGLHFSAPGHAFVADCVLQAIQTHFPDLTVTPCPTTGQWNNSSSTCPALLSRGPYHDHIDHTHVDAAFADSSHASEQNETEMGPDSSS